MDKKKIVNKTIAKLSDQKVKQKLNEIKTDLVKFIDEDRSDLLAKFVEKIGQELDILDNQEIFGDFLQEVIYLNTLPSLKFKKELKELGDKYNVLGLNFKNF